jgi:hypothetical protein
MSQSHPPTQAQSQSQQQSLPSTDPNAPSRIQTADLTAVPTAAVTAPPPPLFSLQTCSPQEYLARTIYPTLAPALLLLDDIRPVDPVEYLALQLYKEADTQRKRVAQLDQIHTIREQLRAEYKKEYSVAGRI